MNRTSSSDRPSCPCKRVSLSLSSLTAAEYGDLEALVSRQLKRRGGDSSTVVATAGSPLHLAAQHGHVAATAWLLQQQQDSSQPPSGGATPLHRASFSGAVATMRLLMSDAMKGNNNNDDMASNLLARDTSFGDQMTPLHKAVSGGRYLAVQLLLQTLQEADMLSQGLEARDAQGRTPRDLAVEKRRNPENVARWDTVAGGPPDWDMCLRVSTCALATAKSFLAVGTSMLSYANLHYLFRSYFERCSFYDRLNSVPDKPVATASRLLRQHLWQPCLLL